MNSIHVECFLNTAAFESYTKAAEYMNLSQPTVSRYITSLEDELGCTLLSRTTKKVEMTDVGRRYFRLFSHWKVEMNETRAEVNRMLGKTNSLIRVGYLEGWPMQPEIQKVCAAFELEHPGIEIHFVAMGCSEIMDALLSETLDTAIMLENLHMDLDNYEKHKICELQKVILYSKNHPLAAKNNLQIVDFLEEDFLVLSEDLDYVLKRNQALYTKFHFDEKIKTIDNMQTLYMTLESGHGVSIQDEWCPNESTSNYRQFPLDNTINIFMVWKRFQPNENLQLFQSYFYKNFSFKSRF